MLVPPADNPRYALGFVCAVSRAIRAVRCRGGGPSRIMRVPSTERQGLLCSYRLEKDLGAAIAAVAQEIALFDPDAAWTKAETC